MFGDKAVNKQISATSKACNRELIHVGMLAESVGLTAWERGEEGANFMPIASDNHEQFSVIATDHFREAVPFSGAPQNPNTQCLTN